MLMLPFTCPPSLSARRRAWTAGIGAALAADVLGVSEAAGELGLIAGVFGFLWDANTKHVAHTLTTDARLTERVPADGAEGEFRYHETQVVSGAAKVNLDLEDCLPTMINGLSRSLAGMLLTRAPAA
jgi:hypothetical protein